MSGYCECGFCRKEFFNYGYQAKLYCSSDCKRGAERLNWARCRERHRSKVKLRRELLRLTLLAREINFASGVGL